jgi:redox-sensing transcriptional repressor
VAAAAGAPHVFILLCSPAAHATSSGLHQANGGGHAMSLPVLHVAIASLALQPLTQRLALWGDGVFRASTGGVALADRLTAGVVARLCWYLQVLTQAKKMGKERISSQEISAYTNINATQIRRDLSGFGKFGKRGVGYSVDSLLGEIGKIIPTQGQHNIALVGAGRLGQAIASSPIFAEHGINIAAVFDRDPDMIGRLIGPNTVVEVESLKTVVRDKKISVGVIAVPAASAQQAADELVDEGVRIILNYSEALLDLPHDVQVHTANPAVVLVWALFIREPVAGGDR